MCNKEGDILDVELFIKGIHWGNNKKTDMSLTSAVLHRCCCCCCFFSWQQEAWSAATAVMQMEDTSCAWFKVPATGVCLKIRFFCRISFTCEKHHVTFLAVLFKILATGNLSDTFLSPVDTIKLLKATNWPSQAQIFSSRLFSPWLTVQNPKILSLKSS